MMLPHLSGRVIAVIPPLIRPVETRPAILIQYCDSSFSPADINYDR